jgi:DnaJ-class molecular chaperone
MSCPSCGGTGFLESHVCPTCAGVGQVHKRETVELRLPADPRDGLELRLRGLGEPGEGGGERGDLYLVLRLQDDQRFRRRGSDLETSAVVAPWEAWLGARVDVRTGRGEVTLRVPPGSRSGRVLRLRGQGLADGQGGHGDCLVRVEMDLPERLTERQQELLRELGGEPRAGEREGAGR